MKLFDRYKISLHNIKNNKSRSILTTMIVYVISLLIMVILCVGLSFSTNMKDVTRKYYEVSDEAIETSYYNYNGNKVLDKEIYDSLAPVLENHQSVISYTRYNFNGGYGGLMVQNNAYSAIEHIEIIEGNNVNEEDVNTNNVLVSSSFAQEYYENTGTVLKPGDTFVYSFNYSYEVSEEMWQSFTKDLELKVAAIYKVKEVEKSEYESSVVSSSTEVIIDAEYLVNNCPNLYYSNVSYYYNMPKSNFNSSEIVEKLDNFVNDLKSVLPNDQEYDNVHCYALQDLKMTETIGLVIIAIAAFLCLILILLSIGSLANTIMISVDKNKKFIGLLKALGLNEKDLKSTIKMESITTIVLGVALSFLTIYLFKDVIGGLNATLINSAFSNYVTVSGYTPVFMIPLFVPVIVLIFFIFFTLLFARGSMSKIAKTDPMAVISEVA